VLIPQLILAAAAVAVTALRPPGATALLAAATTLAVALGAAPAPALAVVAPLVAFLAAALTLASLVDRSGLADRGAEALAAAARGSAPALYALVTAVTALLTAAVSLDGAVVLMVPLVLALTRRFGAPFAPLFLGAVVVANAASIAVPLGNPTNLVVIDRLGLSAAEFTAHMLAPGCTAAAICAAGVALAERRALSAPLPTPARARTPLSGPERQAALALAGAALAAWAAPPAGLEPWWPFAGAVALAVATSRARPRVIVPWRVAGQLTALLIVMQPLALPGAGGAPGLAGLLAIAAAVGAASAFASNLPVSVSASGLLAAGTPAYAASIGLGVGSLATAQGSVATLIARDLAGPDAPAFRARRFAPLAAAALTAATAILWLGL
jgi:arsenical pump membrane protein